VPEGLLLVVWSSIGLWVVGWVGLGWFVGPKFLLCDGLGWVEEIGPMDNSVLAAYRSLTFRPIAFDQDHL